MRENTGICLLNDSFPPLIDGVANAVVNYAQRLTERGVVQTEDAVVTALVSRDQVQRAESRAFVERNFSGSLPGFLNAFVGGRGLSAEEADELRRMIADLEEKNHD